jgi:malate synthase
MLTRLPSSVPTSPGPGEPEEVSSLPGRVRLIGGPGPANEPILTSEALEFLGRLTRAFGARRERLLDDRRELAALRGPPACGPPPETSAIRESSWTIPAPPPGLGTRSVELVGEPTARAITSGLNSKADVVIADFEDLHAPVWSATLHAQWNLAKAVRRTLEYVSPTGERFRVISRPATLMVRPRAWHLAEPHVQIDGAPVPAALFDAGLYLFHNAHELVRCGTGPYFYLPKVQHYLEATLWDEVFGWAESELSLGKGTIRATAEIDSVTAVWEMEEILFALRPHSAGLAFGQLGLMLSRLKGWRDSGAFPNPATLAAHDPFLAACSRSVVRTSHRRGAPALNATPVFLVALETGGPSHPEIARELAAKVRDARAGYDGTWVGHPGAVPVVREFFMSRFHPSRSSREPAEDPLRSGSDSPRAPDGGTGGFTPRSAVRAVVRYLDARLRGAGAGVVDRSVEYAATAEIARTWLWLWTHHDDPSAGEGSTRSEEARRLIEEESSRLRQEAGGGDPRNETIRLAAGWAEELTVGEEFAEFLTLVTPPQPPA